MPHAAGMKIKLNTAEPRIVPVPISSSEMNTPIKLVNNSGAEVPMAIKVAPAISEGSFNAEKKQTGIINYYNKVLSLPLLIISSDDKKYKSHTIPNDNEMYTRIRM